METKDLFTGIGMFLGIILIVLLIIFFFWYFIIGLAMLVCLMFAIIIIVIAVFVVLLLFAIPYFAVTKKPEVQEYASYTLDEVKDKDDEKQQKMQLENSRERYKKRGKARR